MPNRYGLRAAYEPRPTQNSIDTSTTNGVVEAIKRQKRQRKMPSSAVVSLPVLYKKDNKVFLSLFLYQKPGSFSDYKVLPPIAQVDVTLGQLGDDMELIPIEPQNLNLDVLPMTELGSIHKDSAFFSDEREMKKRGEEYHQQKARFYAAVDHLIKIYPNPVELLSIEDKLSAKTYKDYFYSQEEVKFLLPAYQALNPHFFQWLDSATSE